MTMMRKKGPTPGKQVLADIGQVSKFDIVMHECSCFSDLRLPKQCDNERQTKSIIMYTSCSVCVCVCVCVCVSVCVCVQLNYLQQ